MYFCLVLYVDHPFKNLFSAFRAERTWADTICKPARVGNDKCKDEDEVRLFVFCVKVLSSHLTILLRQINAQQSPWAKAIGRRTLTGEEN